MCRAPIRRQQASGAVLGGQVAHDAVRFPQHETVVVDGGHAAIRIHRPVPGLVDAAKAQARVHPLERQTDLGQGPKHLLHIDRTGTAPKFEHGKIFGNI